MPQAEELQGGDREGESVAALEAYRSAATEVKTNLGAGATRTGSKSIARATRAALTAAQECLYETPTRVSGWRA